MSVRPISERYKSVLYEQVVYKGIVFAMDKKTDSIFKDKVILITQHRLVDFTGSEIITLELCEYLSQHGAEVVVATERFSKPIASLFEKLKNVKIIEGFESAALNGLISKKSINIAWIHHQIIPSKLLEKQIRSKIAFIFNHMSAYHYQEFPIFYELEGSVADVILFNSPETMKSIVETKVFDGYKDKLLVLGNPAPEEYFVEDQKPAKDSLKNILVVSNHVPAELSGALKLLKNKKVTVTVAGVSHEREGSYQRVTPELIQSADVVVSIGKTVQYALASMVPVYCYDHFGGPGYLNNKNFKLARDRNFSGRGFSKKSKHQIVKELTDEFLHAQADINSLSKRYAADFSLNKKMIEIISNVNYQEKTKDIKINKSKLSAFNKYQEFIIAFLKQQNDADIYKQKSRETIDKQNTELATLRMGLSAMQQENSNLNNTITEIINSKTYKVANNMRIIKSRLQPLKRRRINKK